MATQKKKTQKKPPKSDAAVLARAEELAARRDARRNARIAEFHEARAEEDTTPIAEALSELNPEAFTLDGFEGALIGIAERCAQPALAVYDRKKCIAVLMRRDEMTEEEAVEFFEFNVAGAWMGEMTPIILDTMEY